MQASTEQEKLHGEVESKNKTNSKNAEGGEAGVVDEKDLPMKESPYLQYKDLEDYKQMGYGTEGHQEPVAGRGGGSTDAPTLSGDSKAVL